MSRRMRERIINLEKEKYIDESWKESANTEKESLQNIKDNVSQSKAHDSSSQESDGSVPEVNFINYVTSLTFQALIFLGEIPHPMEENKIEMNLPQAKFIIDTLIVMREKTKGNLTPEEERLLGASIYELQVKYVEHSSKKGTS